MERQSFLKRTEKSKSCGREDAEFWRAWVAISLTGASCYPRGGVLQRDPKLVCDQQGKTLSPLQEFGPRSPGSSPMNEERGQRAPPRRFKVTSGSVPARRRAKGQCHRLKVINCMRGSGRARA